MVNKVHHRAALIFKTFCSRDPLLLFRAFTVYVRPLLEYCSPVWAPVYKSDIELIERVQRRFTKRLVGLRNLSYIERLSSLNAETLELRRLKQDLVLIHKILHNLVSIDLDEYFCLNEFSNTRGHNLKLVKPICNNNVRQFSFACRRIDAWNFLPVQAVNSQSAASFKYAIKSVNFSKFLLIK